MSTITQIKESLAAVVAGVSGIRQSLAYVPRSLPPGDLPVSVIFTGPGRFTPAVLGRANRLETRTFLVRVYVKPIAQGLDGEAEKAAEPFLRSLPAAFDGREGLIDPGSGEYLAWVQQVTNIGDQGIAVLNLGGEAYVGVELRLEVETYVTEA